MKTLLIILVVGSLFSSAVMADGTVVKKRQVVVADGNGTLRVVGPLRKIVRVDSQQQKYGSGRAVISGSETGCVQNGSASACTGAIIIDGQEQ